jgi:hypothetical protein
MNAVSNEYDVAKTVRTTDPAEVRSEVERIFHDLYPNAAAAPLDAAFRDATLMYSGTFPGFFACDTAYHDIQHVLDVTLAMARLIDGYERSRVGVEPMGEQLFRLGVITALFHDIGYLRVQNDTNVKNGAEFTLTHVSRGASFLRQYMPVIGMPELADTAASLIHFTGYEQSVAAIKVPSLMHRVLGNMLGSADIIAQMSDRCYLEKCRDRLYPEFLAGGLAKKTDANGEEQVVFSSGEDLVRKTPGFYVGATQRLNNDLGGSLAYAESHFGGQNLYLDELHKNINFVHEIAADPELSGLQRVPPDTITLT